MSLSKKVYDANAESIGQPICNRCLRHFTNVDHEGLVSESPEIEGMMPRERFEKNRKFKTTRQTNFKRVSCQTKSC